MRATKIMQDWWKGAVIYHIYPRSFNDSNDNGIGDLEGVIEKLQYIADLGADALWLSPFYPSPMKDFGYDVSDYCNVDPLFGTLDILDKLVKQSHKLGLKVLVDLVLSHTSDKHPWFVQSHQDKNNDKADWYVWADPKPDGAPPNNWLSVFGGSAWAWDVRREQYYMHNFLDSQPDLNFHCHQVQEKILEVMRFWLDRGIDGFRLDTVNLYFHDPLLADNPAIGVGEVVQGLNQNNPLAMQNPSQSATQPENIVFLERMRALTDLYPASVMIGEISINTDQVRVMKEYVKGEARLHTCYVFDLMTAKEFSANFIQQSLQGIMQRVPNAWCSWALCNHDIARTAGRWSLEKKPGAMLALIALMCSVRGCVCLYQGEELGLSDGDVPFERLQDPFGIEFWPNFKGRDGCRTPMPWTDERYAGFSTVEPWLPVDKKHRRLSVERQLSKPDSTLSGVRHFLHWRKEKIVFRLGNIQWLPIQGSVLSCIRSYQDEKVLCLFNLGDRDQCVDLASFQTSNEMYKKHVEIVADRVYFRPWSFAFIALSAGINMHQSDSVSKSP